MWLKVGLRLRDEINVRAGLRGLQGTMIVFLAAAKAAAAELWHCMPCCLIKRIKRYYDTDQED